MISPAQRERWAYFWAAFRSDPIRAVRTEIMRRKVRDMVRAGLHKILDDAMRGPHIIRLPDETDSELRQRMMERMKK